MLKKILIYNSGGGLGDAIQLFPLILTLQHHFKSADLYYQDSLGANYFSGKLKEYDIKIKNLALKEKQLKKIQNWMIEKIEETYININQDNKDCNFTNKWVKN